MDKVIIFGTFGFLGFHFCHRFLEKGCSVKGVHFNMIPTDYLDEKKMEVGRNANFEEHPIAQSAAVSTMDSSPALIIFSLYDLFTTNHETILNEKEVYGPIYQLINERKDIDDKIVCLLPVQLLAESRIEGRTELESFLKDIMEITAQVQCIYLPTIFGPWQPSDFSFQRSIANGSGKDKEGPTSREWAWDAIFIEDALTSIFDIIETKKERAFLLESGVVDSWNLCAEILKFDQTCRENREKLNILTGEQVDKLTISHVTAYSEAIAAQKEHFSRLLWMHE